MQEWRERGAKDEAAICRRSAANDPRPRPLFRLRRTSQGGRTCMAASPVSFGLPPLPPYTTTTTTLAIARSKPALNGQAREEARGTRCIG